MGQSGMGASGRAWGSKPGSTSNSARNALQKQKSMGGVLFTEAYNYMTNDQPLRIHLKVDQDTQVKDMIKKISMLRECNLDATLTKTNLVFFSLDPKTRFVRTIFHQDDKISEVDLITAEIHCQEIMCHKGRDIIKKFYAENPDFLSVFPDSHMKTLTFKSCK